MLKENHSPGGGICFGLIYPIISPPLLKVSIDLSNIAIIKQYSYN
jgi:hypothetical protein